MLLGLCDASLSLHDVHGPCYFKLLRYVARSVDGMLHCAMHYGICIFFAPLTTMSFGMIAILTM